MSPFRHFTEREFYLAEFRRRSIGFVWPDDEAPDAELLGSLLGELRGNETRVVLMSGRDDVLSQAGEILDHDADAAPRVWRAIRAHGSAGVRVPAAGFERICCELAAGLRLAKVVWVRDHSPVVRGDGGGRVSVVGLDRLESLLEDGGNAGAGVARLADRADRPMLEAIRRLIREGVPAVNVCGPKDLAQELLTYSGAGTFFTRERYAEVRKLSLDDYDQANDLIERGEVDGYLVRRDPAARDAVLAYGLGLFVEGRYLAGIGAMLPYPEALAGEIVSLFALTRFAGEGVGAQIVQHALAEARSRGLHFVFACTTSEGVVRFFEEQGFRQVDPGTLPERKWRQYDPARRERVHCLRLDLDPGAGPGAA